MAPDGIAAIVTPGALAGAARDRGRTRAGQRGATRSRVTWGFDVTPVDAGDFRHLPGFYLVFTGEGAAVARSGDLPEDKIIYAVEVPIFHPQWALPAL